MKIYIVVGLALVGAALSYASDMKGRTQWPAIAFVALAIVLAVIL